MDTLIETRYVLLVGLAKTVEIFILSALLAAALAFLLGTLRTSSLRPLRIVTAGVVEILRGVSTVVVLFWLYFALPFLGIKMQADTAAILGLGMVHGAYSSEIVRGAINSVQREQWEAATAVSFSRLQTLRLIIMPQALLIMLPPFGNSLVLLLKGTSIASIITVQELTFQASLVVTRTLAVTSVFVVVLVAYYLLSMLAVRSLRFVERRLSYWRPEV
jgi:polar amino acid transport system permease protein